MDISQKEVENIISQWFIWHFLEVPKFLLKVWKNYLIFATNYFSLTLLLKTLFAPWRRYKWGYPKGFDLVEFFNTLISNTFSRILGAMMRMVLIALGILMQLFVVLLGAIIFVFWLLVPFLIIGGLLYIFI